MFNKAPYLLNKLARAVKRYHAGLVPPPARPPSEPSSEAASPALFRAFPELQSAFPWRSLGRFPTPVAPLAALGADLGLPLFVKRDDQSGLPYGGNKVRKLEFLLADALARGRRRLVTFGGFGSHQILASALYGAQLGLGVCGVVLPQPPTPHACATLLQSAGAGACLHYAPGLWAVPLVTAGCALRHAASGAPALVWPGGSNPVGTLGYVSGALELAEQVRRGQCPEPDLVVVAVGSGGTAAGLLVGFRLAGLATRILAVRVTDRIFASAASVARLARRTARRIVAAGGPDAGSLRARDLEVAHGFFGGAYGRPTPEAERALALLRDREGIVLETTYTAKALAALLARAGALGGRKVLFWNTFSSAPTAALARAPASALPPRLARLFAATPKEVPCS